MSIPINKYPDFLLHQADSLELLSQMQEQVDMIFADPPYFLSNGGRTISNGKIVSVNKGTWDMGGTPEVIYEFNRKWLKECRRLLRDNGTIWVCGTYHNQDSVCRCLTELGFQILNIIVWQKSLPADMFSKKRFKFSAELIIWASKAPKAKHKFNYELMTRINGGHQMTDVWRMPSVKKWEKTCGHHPTQKPLCLLNRIILSTTNTGDTILDPFAGSCTTGIAANLLGRKFIGIEQDEQFINLGLRRREEIENELTASNMRIKMLDIEDEVTVLVNHCETAKRLRMIERGMCYLRICSADGSLLVREGYERLQYVLLHSGGSCPQLFRLKNMGHFRIYTKEELTQMGFNPEHALYYAVVEFDNLNPIPFNRLPNLHIAKATGIPDIRPLSQFIWS